MESLINFFTTIPSSYRAAILVGGLVVFWTVESLVPLFTTRYDKWRHAGLNLFFTLTTVVVNFAFAVLILRTSDWAVAHSFGLLHVVQMPLWLFMLAGLLLLDLVGAYWIHWIQHKVKWMWKFHLIHHTDTHVDATTANRHHPGESVFRAVFTLLAVAVTGAPMWLVMLYQSLSVVFSQFNHANISLPAWLDRAVSWLIVSPNMHKVHHHYAQPLTDTNYGNIFSIWDRVFGTFASVPDTRQLTYGVDTHPEPAENDRLGNLLRIPFQPYRPPAGRDKPRKAKEETVS
ncbi:MAG: sterol desaturase family protein [Cytophagales bacterium]|jgi:sterol desaturase/sphingolipid hydroxylase (fatty acid hydroxylase superfamily)|nr:sterol desaturase family protein [Cytophagales bacterium]